MKRRPSPALVEEAGVPPSSIYHYFGSKDGVLLAVMERGAERFFAALPELGRRRIPAQHLRGSRPRCRAGGQSDFLRCLWPADQPSGAGDGRVDAEVGRVREVALTRLRKQIALAFQERPRQRDHRPARPVRTRRLRRRLRRLPGQRGRNARGRPWNIFRWRSLRCAESSVAPRDGRQQAWRISALTARAPRAARGPRTRARCR